MTTSDKTDGSDSAGSAVGAYGFRLRPEVFGRRYLHSAAPDWPLLDLQWRTDPPTPDDEWPEVISGPGWGVHVAGETRETVRVAHVAAVAPGADARIHPALSLAALAATLTLRGDSLHASGVLTDDGVVAVLAPTNGGKTTTVAWLATRLELGVFTDDHLNIRDGLVRAGPRCLDLRPDAAQALDLESRATIVRGPEARRRIELPTPARVAAPVVRTVVLGWGDRVTVTPVPPRERLPILATQRAAQPVAGGLDVPLDLAAVPMVRIDRPRDFAAMPEFARALLGG